MKYKDIAAKYDVTINTVKSWKSRYCKDKEGCTQKKKVAHKKVATKVAEKMINENGELDEDKQLFCIYYLKYFNATKAYMKVKPETPYASASVMGCRWYNLPEVQEEIKRLKKEMCAEALIDPVEIVQKYIDMAFYDVTDYAEFKGGVVLLKDSSCVDGTLIQEIKQGKEGVAVKFVDRSKALDWLSKHMNLATEEQKAKIDLIKAQTQKITGDEDTETIDDGFMDALNGTAKEDWDGYEED